MSTNETLYQRQLAATGGGVGVGSQFYAARAKNAELWDVEGRRYIDFAGGIGVLATGHCHPRVTAAVHDQLDRFHHTAYQVVPYPDYIELAERLNTIAPIDGRAKTNLFNTGAEAVENAVKIAKAATGRDCVIAFAGSFHGRTAMAMALTGKVTPYKRAFGASVSGVYHVPFPIEYHGIAVEDSLRAIQMLFAADVAPERVAAIIIEPIQGEGGFHVAPPELLRALRALCDEHGIQLVVDEVQTGFARTGRMFAIEHSGVKPDLIVLAKSLAGGFPLSAVVGRAGLMDSVEAGGLGGTYAGAPLACAAALAVLDVIAEEELVARADAIGQRMRVRIAAFAGGEDLLDIENLRGLGAMIAFDIEGTDEPAAVLVKRTLATAAENGLIVLSAGTRGETIRLLVPLTASDAIIDEGMDLLEAALRVRVAVPC